jgi:hypothetical protein
MPLKFKFICQKNEKQVIVYGDCHNEGWAETEYTGDILAAATQCLNENGVVFIELAEYYFTKGILRDKVSQGLECAYYSVPLKLRESVTDLDRLVIKDDRATSSETPFASWIRVSDSPSETTISTWQSLLNILNKVMDIRAEGGEVFQRFISCAVEDLAKFRDVLSNDLSDADRSSNIHDLIREKPRLKYSDANFQRVFQFSFDIGMVAELAKFDKCEDVRRMILFVGANHAEVAVNVLEKDGWTVASDHPISKVDIIPTLMPEGFLQSL